MAYDVEISELSLKADLIEEAINFFWKHWGSESNFNFYSDCITHSLDQQNALPKFYIGTIEVIIVCSYALLTNDIISRQDLMPWFACLYVDESYRNQGIAASLLVDGLLQAKAKGYKRLYLSTDLVDFYEKNGWEQYGVGYGTSGDAFKIYSKET